MAYHKKEYKRFKRREDDRLKEDYAIVLDFLPNGTSFRGKYFHYPVAQIIGKNYFTLLLVNVRRNFYLKPYDEVYIGNDKREKINRIIGKLNYNELTQNAKLELPFIIEYIVKNNEKFFINFFNNAQPLTTRMHSLELLDGVGKKLMWEILEARKEKPFESFDDLKKRVKSQIDFIRAISNRILEEIKGNQKHYIFVLRNKDNTYKT